MSLLSPVAQAAGPAMPRLDAEACRDGSAETLLALAVLLQALHDLTRPLHWRDNGPRVRAEAAAFCFSHEAAWRAAREKWCSAAGVEESVFRAAARRRLAL